MNKHKLPFEKIEHITGSRWSSDTWASETCLCLRSPVRYQTPLAEKYGFHPYRPHFLNILRIYKSAYIKLRMHKQLSQLAHMADILFICEVGRGLDLLLAQTVKSAWKLIRCYDAIDWNKGPLMNYFSHHPVDYFTADSRRLDFSSIRDRTILIASEHSIPSRGVQEIMKNNSIVSVIINGESLRNSAFV